MTENTKAKTMKKCIWKNIITCLMAFAITACSQDTAEIFQCEENVEVTVSYRMRFKATLDNYADAINTRAGYSWNDGAKVYLRFNDAAGVINGVATYEVATDTWNVKSDKALTAGQMANCEAHHFVNPASSNSLTVSLTAKSVIYSDKEATYLLEEDILSVTAVLSPITGRLRFKGTEGTSFGVTGLSFYSTYNVSSNTFTSKKSKITDTIESDGYSTFYYVSFCDEDDRSMVFDYISTASYKRTFGKNVLSPGSSGFISVPTLEHHDYWTLVSVANGNEITLPELSTAAYSSVKSSSVYLESSVTDTGNGTLSDVGFVCATHSDPTLEDTRLSCGKSTSFAGRIFSLTPTTLYYVRSYATNEAGTVYSEVTSFTTKEAPVGSKIEIDDFPDENDWD